jgi:hypothetical protein
MKNLLKIFLLISFLLCNFMAIAKQPGDDDGEGGLEGGDQVPASINGRLVLLAIVGVCYAFYFFKRRAHLCSKKY